MTHGMICCPQPEAADAGADILSQGGNAVDAAIACALVQGVVDLLMCGIAGFGSMHLYLPGSDTHGFIDFHAVPCGGDAGYVGHRGRRRVRLHSERPGE